MNPIVKVTAHKEILIIEGPGPDFTNPDWVPAGSGRIGCVLLNTEVNLGVSEEALALLRNVTKVRDAIGDLMWFQSGDKECFGWLGPSSRLLNPKTAVGDRDYRVGKHLVIPNEPPEEAVKALDDA